MNQAKTQSLWFDNVHLLGVSMLRIFFLKIQQRETVRTWFYNENWFNAKEVKHLHLDGHNLMTKQYQR